MSANDIRRGFLSLILIAGLSTLVGCSNDVMCLPFCDSNSSSGVDDEDTGDEDTEDENAITNINLIGPNGGGTFELIGSSQPLNLAPARLEQENTSPRQSHSNANEKDNRACFTSAPIRELFLRFAPLRSA